MKIVEQGTLIGLNAANSFNFITDKIYQEDIEETQDLFNEIVKLEHLVKNKLFKSEFVSKPI